MLELRKKNWTYLNAHIVSISPKRLIGLAKLVERNEIKFRDTVIARTFRMSRDPDYREEASRHCVDRHILRPSWSESLTVWNLIRRDGRRRCKGNNGWRMNHKCVGRYLLRGRDWFGQSSPRRKVELFSSGSFYRQNISEENSVSSDL